ncbi:Alpha/Beta hydrolase fold [Elaphomyces granulatus]
MQLVSGFFSLACLCGLGLAATDNSTNSTASAPSMVQLSTDPDFHFELLRQLAVASYGGADIGEVLTAAAKIVPGDFESFYCEFDILANRVLQQGQAIDAGEFPVSVRDTMFRAASYFQSADFYLHGNQSDPRIISLWESMQGIFNISLSLLPVPGRRVNVQADGFYVPCIFYKASPDDKPRPTLIIGGGYDKGQEELYHFMVKATLQRGWNAITYEGPGQASPRRYQNLTFIPQWEKVVTPVVDYLETLPEVDKSALALVGISFGGLLASRAAAFEHRLVATVCLDGIYDFFTELMAAYPAGLTSLFESGNATAFDAAINAARNAPGASTAFKWVIDQGLWAWKTTSPFDLISQFKAYTLVDVIDQIPGPVFVGDAQDDIFLKGAGAELASHLGDRAHYYLFKTAYGDGEHSGIGSFVFQNQVVMDWLKPILEKSGR